MIQLNKENGHIRIDKIEISAAFSPSDLKDIEKIYQVKLLLENKNTKIYAVTGLESPLAVGLLFDDGVLLTTSIEINLPSRQPYVVTDVERELLRDLYNQFTPPTRYQWGNIAIVDDIKGGSFLLVFSYLI